MTLLTSSCSSSRKISKDINTTFNDFPAFMTGFSGLMVYDPSSGETIYSLNADKYFTPASNTKLFTFYAGLKLLGDSVPALEYISTQDSLIFRGTGDPSFLYDKFQTDRVFKFLKGSNDTLFYAPPSQELDHFGPGWAWDDYHYYYSVERAAMPIYGNYTSFHFSPERAEPRIEPDFFSSFAKKDSIVSSNSTRAFRERHQNQFLYHHSIGSDKKVREVPFIHSPQLLVSLLSDTLNKPVKLLENSGKDWKNSEILYSLPSDSLYKRMLQVSDNFIAEQILLMGAKAVADTLDTDIALEYMKEHHLQDLPDEPVWVDGSGLSVYNKFTPRSLVRLLEKIYEEVPRERLFQLLPAGGESGTIKNFYKAEEPYIYAKTGTISNVHTLSGYLVTKSGKVLIFSFMNNNYTVPSSKIKEGMEIILRNIYLNY